MGERTGVEQLLRAANDAAAHARTIWVTFLLFATYLAITVGSTTHVDLLLQNPVTLPLLDVQLDLIIFYWVAPLFLLLYHLYTLIAHYILAGKLHAFNNVLAAERLASADRERLRQQVHPSLAAQSLAGPRHARLPALAINFTMWATLVVGPLVLLLAFQIRFLPYHHEYMTWAHRAFLVVDLGLAWIFWPLIHASGPRLRRLLPTFGLQHTPRAIGSIVLSAMLMFFSLGVATFPGEPLERWLARPALSIEVQGRPVFWPTAALFDGDVDPITWAPDTWFSRNLFAINADFAELRLRGRDLSYAVFSGSTFDEADFSYAKLQGVTLWGAQLKGAVFEVAHLRGAMLQDAQLENARLGCPFFGAPLQQCTQLQGARFDRARLQGARLNGADARDASFRDARLQGADLNTAVLYRADFTRAHLESAGLSHASLQGADLRSAQLQGVTLTNAALNGANLRSAQLHGAVLTNAHLQGAVLDGAQLQGAKLDGAHLQGAVLDGAHLQGAVLDGAHLQGATLRATQLQAVTLQGADLRGATFKEAHLQGSVLDGARLQGAALRFAGVWRTSVADARTGLVDARDVNVTVMPPEEVDRLLTEVGDMSGDENVRDEVLARLEVLRGEPPEGEETAERERWRALASVAQQVGYQEQLIALLSDLACAPADAPWVAMGIVRRIEPRHGPDDAPVRRRVAERLLDPECEGTAGLGLLKTVQGGLIVTQPPEMRF